LPLAGALALGALFARQGSSQAVIAVLVGFVVLDFLGLKLLPRLQGVLAKWLS
jgi:hypothetical protein